MDGESEVERLSNEATKWMDGTMDRSGFHADDDVPRAKETEMISMRIPKKQLQILREFARRQGLGYQVLIKQWLDDRIRFEFETLKSQKVDVTTAASTAQFVSPNHGFELVQNQYVRSIPVFQTKAASFVATRPISTDADA